MKLDHLVYGRGVEQSTGYALQAAPPYVRQELLLYLSDLLELGDERLRAEFPPGAASDPWADTWLFVCQPPPCCCAMVRMIRAEGEHAGEWLREVRGKTVWSLEGWCAPYEQRELFFALLPSVLHWMQEDNSSLYNRSRLHRITQQAELPEQFLYDPYTEENTGDTAWDMLCRHIRLAPQPFPFLIGSLADFYAQRIGRRYGVGHVFPANAPAVPELPEDAFASVRYASLRQKAPVRRQYALRMQCEAAGKRDMQRRWVIREEDKPEDAQLASAWQSADREQGTAMAELLAESELIRGFAGRMGWETAPPTAPPEQRYRYSKEE